MKHPLAEPYEEESVLRWYILRHYPQLLSDLEDRVWRTLVLEEKTEFYKNHYEKKISELEQPDFMFSEYSELMNDTEIVDALRYGKTLSTGKWFAELSTTTQRK